MYQISEFLGMGANVECNSYFPGYLSTRNHNLNANGSERNHNLSPNHFLGYYKEVLKQTMLKQETILKDQIQDLHRLYGRQRELMYEIRKNELDKHHHLKMEASQLTSAFSQTLSVSAQKTFHIPCLPLVNPTCSQISVSGAESIQAPSRFGQGRNIQTCSYSAQTEGRSGDSELFESNCQKFRKNLLDIELPADAYIDSEEEELLENGKFSEAPEVSSSPLKRIPEVVCNGNAKQFLGTNGFNSVSGDDTDFELFESNCKKFENNLLDLELPAAAYIDSEEEELVENVKVSEAPELSSSPLKIIPEVVCNVDAKQFLGTNRFKSVPGDDTSSAASLEKGSTVLNDLHKLKKETAPASDNFVGPTSHMEIPRSGASQKAKSGFQDLSNEFIQDARIRQDFEFFSNVILQETESKHARWLSYNYEAGKSKSNMNSFPQGFHAEKLSASSNLLHEELKRVDDPPTFYQSNQNSWSERALFGPNNDSKSGASGASFMCTPYQNIPRDNMAGSGSSYNPALRKTIHDFARTPIAVQALPCFNTSVPFGNSSKSPTVSPGLDGDWLQLQKDLRSSIKHDNNIIDSSFTIGSQLESKKSESYAPYMSSDNRVRIGDDLVSKHHGITKCLQDSANVKCQKDMNLNFLPPSCSLDVADSQSFQTTGAEMVRGSNVGLPWHRRNLVYNGITVKGLEDSNQAEASDSSSKRIREPPTCEKPIISGDNYSHGSPSTHQNPPEDVKNSKKARVFDLNLACDSVLNTEMEPTSDEHVAENEFDKKDVGHGVHIDLNSSIIEDDFSPMPSLSKETLLEEPASPENMECSPPRGESDENHVETPVLLAGQEDLENKECSLPVGESDDNQIETPFLLSGQKVDLEEELARIAAESLVSISSSAFHTSFGRSTHKPFKTSCDSLHWFAGIVSSVLGGPQDELGVVWSNKYCGDHEELLPDGMDYFEAMTLKLTESKLEECCCRTNGHKEEDTGTTSSLSQPRKGRTRRGRQRKDFQREILPSLASLSRYEVTVDLNTMGGLIEASGNLWGTGSAICAAKIVSARGRRRSSISASTVTENTSEPLLKQIGGKIQLGNEKRRLIDWGEVTRRRRGQRYPVGNRRLILSKE